MKINPTQLVGTTLFLMAFAIPLQAQTTAFTYQGRLNDNGLPASGIYDLRFTMYGSVSGGAPAAGPVTNSPVSVSNGLFVATIDFGVAPFTGADRWLQIAVRTNGSGSFTDLTARQPLTSTPYAVRALNAATAAAANSVSASAVGTLGISDGSIIAADLSPGLVNNTFWRLDGNGGTTPGINFLGTTDNQPLELKINGTRAFRLEPDPRGQNAANVVGGHPENSIANGIGGSVIVGGGFPGGPNRVEENSHGVFIGAGSLNVVRPNSSDAVIVGGFGNGASGYATVVGGGQGNTSTGYTATVAGGFFNTASGDGASVGGGGVNLAQGLNAGVAGGAYNTNTAAYSAIGGGLDNDIEAGSSLSFIGGGWLNLIQAGADQAVIAGGNANRISSGARYPFIGGGWANHVQSNAIASFIGGGTANTNSGGGAFIGGGFVNRAENFDAVVVGGAFNVNAGNRSFIGGGEGNVISNTGSFITIGGGRQNVVIAGASTIAGGSQNIIGDGAVSSAINGGLRNTNLASQSVIAGGGRNTIEVRAIDSIIGGGILNTIQSNAFQSTIAGGRENKIWTNAESSTIGGGVFNDIEIGTIKATIGGGEFQTIRAGSSGSTISGGSANTISSNSILGTLAGGQFNLIRTATRGATLSGGVSNIVGGRFAVVPGGLMNSATGAFSFAGGLNASALHNGAFVWADSNGTNFSSTASNQFLIRASGGVGINTTNPTTALEVVGTVKAGGFMDNGSGFVGNFIGNGASLSNVNAATLGGLASSNYWQLGGNSDNLYTVLGTRNDRPLIMIANNQRGLQLDAAFRSLGIFHGLLSANVTGGQQVNSVWTGVLGGTIGGGGLDETFLLNDTPYPNIVSDDFGTIGGGLNNTVGNTNADPADVRAATVSGGENNHAAASHATVGGGIGNSAAGFAGTVSGGNTNRANGDFATVSGGVNNGIGSNSGAAAIGGGAANVIEDNSGSSTIGGGFGSRIANVYATVGGGLFNTNSGFTATVGGGEYNIASASYTTVAGGSYNIASASEATVGGGYRNAASGPYATVGGGDGNGASGAGATVAGGESNGAGALFATIGGGIFNEANGYGATVGGGPDNTASGHAATVPGGQDNVAQGDYSFAAGYRAKADHAGSFVWADSTEADFSSSAANQFLVRASRGVGINNANPAAMLHIGDTNLPNSQGMIRLASRSGTGLLLRHWDIGVPEDDTSASGKFYSFVIDDPRLGTDPEVVVRWDTGNVGIGVNHPTSRLHVGAGGVRCEMGLGEKFSLGGNGSFEIDAPGIIAGRFVVQNGGNVGIGTASPSEKLHVAGNILASGNICANNGVQCISDRNKKAGFTPVDAKAILEKVAAMSITRWRYTNDTATPHIGPVAQDFHAAFGVGSNDKQISTVDADGVALAAIQGLNQKLEEKDARIVELERRLEKLERLLNRENEGAR